MDSSKRPVTVSHVRKGQCGGLLSLAMILAIVIGLLIPAVDLMAATDTIYVDVSGSDVTGDGSQSAPYATIRTAFDRLDTAASDHLVLVGPGTYTDTTSIMFPFAVAVTLRSTGGPFVTELVSNASFEPVVVMTGTDATKAQIIDGFTIRDHYTQRGGDFRAGAIDVGYATFASIYNCIIRGNRSDVAAGGIHYEGINGTIANNWIISNSSGATSSGAGGVYIKSSANVTFVNNTVANNFSDLSSSAAAGILLGTPGQSQSAVAKFDNNVIAFNQPGYGLNQVNVVTFPPYMNNLYSGNGDTNAVGGISLLDPVTTLREDPAFVDTLLDDYHLRCGSPAHTAGSPTVIPADISFDIDGQPRVDELDGTIDIGADQFYDEDKVALFDAVNTLACPGELVVFNNKSTFCIDEGWLWNFGDGSPLDSTRYPTHAYQSPGVYSVTLTVQGRFASDVLTRTDYITVSAPPTAGFSATGALTGCDTLTVEFVATGDVVSNTVNWDFGDGVMGQGATVVHQYTSPGSYTVQLSVLGPCDTTVVSEPAYIVVSAPVSAVDFSADTLVGCDSLTVVFTAADSGSVIGYEWDFGDSTTGQGNPVTHTYTGPGEFSVSLDVLGQCDTVTVTKADYIRVDEPAVLELISDTVNGCNSLTVQFVATANAIVDSFIWSFGDTSPVVFSGSGTVDTVVHTYTGPGNYTVRVTAANSCGADSVTWPDSIHIGNAPFVTIFSSHDSVTGVICAPYTVQFGFTSSQPLLSYQWDFGDDSTSTDSTPVHTYFEGGRTYSVRLIATGVCGTDTIVRNQYITIQGVPSAAPTVTPLFTCAGSGDVTFDAQITGTYDSARWVFGDGADAPGPIVTYSYPVIGEYIPFVIMSHPCGTDTVYPGDTVTVSDQPAAVFTMAPDSGYEPLTVQFTDQTTNIPAQWLWTFGDGDSSVEQNPVHVFSAGVSPVALRAVNVCGESTRTGDTVRVGGFEASFDSIGTAADTIIFNVVVDSIVFAYDRAIDLSAQLTTAPRRGSIMFRFPDSAAGVWIPPFATPLQLIPSVDLAGGDYTIELTVADPARISKSAQRTFHHDGRRYISVTPSPPIVMDSTIVTVSSSRIITIKNNAAVGSGIFLNVQNPLHTGEAFDVAGTGKVLVPQERLTWTIAFTPPRKGEFSGTVRIRSDDPATPDTSIAISGKGIGEQIPPKVTLSLPDSNLETTIDDSIRIEFSEPIVVIPADTVLVVRSVRLDSTLQGLRRWDGDRALEFIPIGFFPADDTISVVVRAVLTDTNGNFLDGNRDGTEQKAPADNFVFEFTTGPGVYPGDADNNGRVNEGDILPLGRYWGMNGPPRTNPQAGFTLQPARAWDDRMATYADADGNGVVDSADVCPIVEFFDRQTGLARGAVEQWMTEAERWPDGIAAALLAALDNCPAQGSGRRIVRRFLESLTSRTAVPRDYSLAQNYPNPFNPATVIEYTLPAKTEVRLDVFDIQGRRVRTLEQGKQEAGRYARIWDGRDRRGRALASGVYFYRLVTPRFRRTRKMILLK